jgi:hypothetical protein
MKSRVGAIDSFAPAHSPFRASRPCRGLPARSIHRIARASGVLQPLGWAIGVNRPYLIAILAIACFCLTSCASVSHHQFSEPAAGWQTKTGQLLYRTANATLIGEALVRFSNAGDFELTVSKGPGITLLSLRQDAGFAEFNASFTNQRWSGPTANAPPQLRGWLRLRDQFLRAPNQKTLQYVSGSETFLFRF